jgi:hypothetical protein
VRRATRGRRSSSLNALASNIRLKGGVNMRYEYTIRASVIYEINIMADDEDDAIEKASSVSLANWSEIDVEYFINDIEPVERTAPDVDH